MDMGFLFTYSSSKVDSYTNKLIKQFIYGDIQHLINK